MMQPAGDVDYDSVGQSYAQQRRTDPRIAAQVHAALGDARTVLNVGAGAGSYEPLDRYVLPIEPAASMRAQRPGHLAPAIHGIAENLPLDDASVDAAMAMVTVHQWRDLSRGLGELRRVTRGPVVILTFEGAALDRFWLAEYAPELIEAERGRYPTLAAIEDGLGCSCEVHPVLIPFDCTDGFTEAFYGRPERLLDPQVRQAQSAWGFVPPGAIQRAVGTLEDDLATGLWDRRFGYLRRQPEFEGSLQLIIGRPGP